MKLVWSPEKASKAYLDTVKSCELLQESNVAELVSAMAAGWDAQMIVETWSRRGDDVTSTSIGLSIASKHTGGKHICIVPDKDSRIEYILSMDKTTGMFPEVVFGEPEEAMENLVGIDFLVVDSEKNDFSRILKVAKLSHRGAVLVCKNVSSRIVSDFRWRSVLDGKSRIVRSVFLPVGKGLDIAHVGATGSGTGEGKRGTGGKVVRKWIRRFDRESGEEFVIRK
ncbi:uncharacterized protein [Nicotiana tomentosiformis]|uniref:uncharacterized protein n=1 Tax=Nicotiana tomentosiformis TaxID=4098 RepID=UPI00051AD29F|nr:uncharacterized protein LOC104088000 [Nicotiana tomentosiformis]